RIRIEDDLTGAEPMPVFRLVSAVDTVAVKMVRQHVGEGAVPDLVGMLRQWNANRLPGSADGIEQAQFNAGRMLGKQGEIDAGAVPGSAQWIGSSGPNSHGVVLRWCQPSRPDRLSSSTCLGPGHPCSF